MSAKKVATIKSPVKNKQVQVVDHAPLFGRTNYLLMALGMVVMALGMLLMSGGKSPDPNVFNYDEIYSFRRVTLAPILILAGLIIEIYAIFRKR